MHYVPHLLIEPILFPLLHTLCAFVAHPETSPRYFGGPPPCRGAYGHQAPGAFIKERLEFGGSLRLGFSKPKSRSYKYKRRPERKPGFIEHATKTGGIEACPIPTQLTTYFCTTGMGLENLSASRPEMDERRRFIPASASLGVASRDESSHLEKLNVDVALHSPVLERHHP